MSKLIEVSYFAVFREKAGRDSETFNTKSETVLDLFSEIKKIHGFGEPQGHCKVAINNDLVQWDAKIENGDKVLFFPPVSGG